jgi:hypothetical protein
MPSAGKTSTVDQTLAGQATSANDAFADPISDDPITNVHFCNDSIADVANVLSAARQPR